MIFRKALVAAWSTCVCVAIGGVHAAAAPGAGPYGGTAVVVPGTIEAENFDDGGSSIAYVDMTPGNRGNVYRQTDVDIEATSDAGGGWDIGWTRAGEWLQYAANVSASAAYAFELRVASPSTGATVRLEVDGVDVTGLLAVPNTGGWQVWTTIRKDGIVLQAGFHRIRLVFVAAGTDGIANVNFLKIVPMVPAPWTSRDIGQPVPAGTASFADNTYTVKGAGADIWGTSDSFQFLSQPAAGDTQIVVRVASVQNTNASAKAGVMLRESAADQAAHVLLDVAPGGSVEFMTRRSTGAGTTYLAGTTVTFPAWLKLSRIGTSVVGSVSTDGVTWRPVGTTSLSAALALVGVAVNSHATTLNTSVFDNVTVGAPPAPPAPPPTALTAVAPSNGAPGVALNAPLSWSAIGATSYDVMFGTSNPPPAAATGLTNATYAPAALTNAQTDHWQVAARNSGGTTTSPVWSFTTIAAPPAVPVLAAPADASSGSALDASLTWTSNGATTYDVRFGGTNAPAAAATGLTSASYTPAALEHDTTYYWQVVAQNAGGTTEGPVWAFKTIVAAPGTPTVAAPADSANGVPVNASLTWTASGATSYDIRYGTTNPPPDTATGLVTASYTPASMATGTTYFWQVVARNDGGATPGPVWSFATAGLPAPWTNLDVGAVGLPGSANYANGAFTIAGAGAAIWGSADAFQFVSQTLTGDLQIVARVISLQNTQAKAKAGLMLRESNAPDAAHVILDVKPAGGGVEFMTRAIAGGQTTKQSNTAASAPVYLRLTRTGKTVVGAVSADGVVWTTVGTQMTSAAWPLAGLAVTSQNTTLLNTAVFDEVAISVPAVTPIPPPPPSRAGVSPTAYNAITDRTPYFEPALPQLGPAGFTFNDPTFGSKMLRVTDALTRPGSPNRSYRAPSNPLLSAWNASSTAFYVISNDGTAIPFAFDGTSLSAVRLQPSATGNGGTTLGFYQEPHFSAVDPNLIYGAVAGTNNRTVGQYDFQARTYTPLLDLDTIASGLAGTYLGVVATGGSAPEKLMVVFGGGSQDNHFLAMWAPIGNFGARKVLNTLTSTINGVPTNITLNFHLHSAFIDKSGRYVLLGPRGSDLGSPRFAAQEYVWDTTTDTITAVTTSMLSGGHGTAGYGTWINQDCCTSSTYDGLQWQFRYLNDLHRTGDLISPVLQPKKVYIADHTSWHNSRPDALVPVISATYRSTIDTTPWRAWDDEIIAIDTTGGVGGVTYRFAHHRSDIRSDTDPTVNYFWYQPIAAVSPDGRYAIFTSNWEKTLGRDSSEGTFRQDVFLVQLTPR